MYMNILFQNYAGEIDSVLKPFGVYFILLYNYSYKTILQLL